MAKKDDKNKLALFYLILILLALSLSKILLDQASAKPPLPTNYQVSQPTPQPKQLIKPSAAPILKNYQAPLLEAPVKQLTVPILTYHYISDNPNPADKLRDNLSVSPAKFEEQMDYLAKNSYHPISLDTMMAALNGVVALPSKAVVLTFDDGYIDFFVNAFPVLKKYNFHAVVFIPTGLLGKGYYMSWDQLKQLEQSGLVSIQAHSITHAQLTLLSAQQLKFQVTESKKMLENFLGHPVNFFAYPYGASNPAVWQAVKDAGFIGAVGTYYGNTVSVSDIYNMPRIKVAGEWAIATFASKI